MIENERAQQTNRYQLEITLESVEVDIGGWIRSSVAKLLEIWTQKIAKRVCRQSSTLQE